MDGASTNVWDRPDVEEGEAIIGIDLGTTNSCVAVWEHPVGVSVIKNRWGQETTPSIVAFDVASPEVFVGASAAKQPGNVVHGVKRMIGVRYEDTKLNSSVAMPSIDGTVDVQVVHDNQTVRYSPVEISSRVLLDLKSSAEEYLGRPVHHAVICVPAYFSDAQRICTREAAALAGLNVTRLLNEPTAAAMAYGLHVAGEKRVLVFDWGGGTLDVSLIHLKEGCFRVMAVGGDTQLGGQDIDALLQEYMLQQYPSTEGGPEDRQAESWFHGMTPEDRQALAETCEAAKRALSDKEVTSLHMAGRPASGHQTRPDQTRPASGRGDHTRTLTCTLTRSKLEALCKPLFDQCLAVVQDTLEAAGVTSKEVQELVLVGGSTRIPELRRRLREMFGGRQLCTAVDPDKVVAEGAAIQGAILGGVDIEELRDMQMMDVLPRSIGLEEGSGAMRVLLPRNTAIPCQRSDAFATSMDGQKGITVAVFEGEQPVAQDNIHLADFDFPVQNAHGAKAGERLVEVTFSMSEDGILKVDAVTLGQEAPSLLKPIAMVLGAFFTFLIVVCAVATWR